MVRIEPVDSRIQGIVLNETRTCWVIRDDKTILIDSGFPSETGLLLEGLGKLDLALDDLDYLALTHVHIDHAGGAGNLARENSRLTIFVHELGAHHLTNPFKLNQGVRRAYGKRFAGVGEIAPIADKRRIVSMDTRDAIELGKSRLDVLYTPGHAKHHVVYFDRISGSVFSGDALGSQYKGLPNFVLSPPSDYDKQKAKESIDLIAGLHPERINFTHCGHYRMNGKNDFYDNLKNNHDQWNDCVMQIITEDPTRNDKELFDIFLERIPDLKKHPSQFFSFHLSVQGILIYLKKSGMIQ